MHYYNTLCDFVTAICKFLIMVMVPVMAVIVITQVVMRYLFQASLIWAEEAARYLLIWISCLGSAYAVRKKSHISVLFLHDRFDEHVQRILNLIIHSLVICFFMLSAFYGFILSASEWEQISPGLRMRMTWVLISIPVGFGMMAVFTLEDFISEIKNIIKKEPMA